MTADAEESFTCNCTTVNLRNVMLVHVHVRIVAAIVYSHVHIHRCTCQVYLLADGTVPIT